MSQLSNIRIGRITSSDIVSLVSNGTSKDSIGAPFYTYVQDCIIERFFKQRLENDVEVLALAWGKICEKVVHNNLLPLSYIFHSDQTLVHPEIKDWVGSPDGSKSRWNRTQTITDIKCPLTRRSFFNLIFPLYEFNGIKAKKRKKVNGLEAIKYIRDNHKEGNKYYWQLVSNACITGSKYAELIIFMPYYEELFSIRAYNANLDKPNFKVTGANDDELPFIYRQSGVKNLNIIRFEVPEEDKQFLKERVKLAVELIYEGNTDKKFMQEKVKELINKK